LSLLGHAKRTDDRRTDAFPPDRLPVRRRGRKGRRGAGRSGRQQQDARVLTVSSAPCGGSRWSSSRGNGQRKPHAVAQQLLAEFARQGFLRREALPSDGQRVAEVRSFVRSFGGDALARRFWRTKNKKSSRKETSKPDFAVDRALLSDDVFAADAGWTTPWNERSVRRTPAWTTPWNERSARRRSSGRRRASTRGAVRFGLAWLGWFRFGSGSLGWLLCLFCLSLGLPPA